MLVFEEPEIYTEVCERPIAASIVQDLLAQISWYHHIALLDTVKDVKERVRYIRQPIQNGWSRKVLVHQIESGLFYAPEQR